MHKHSLQKGIKGNRGHFFYGKWHCWGRLTSFKMAVNLKLIAIYENDKNPYSVK